ENESMWVHVRGRRVVADRLAGIVERRHERAGHVAHSAVDHIRITGGGAGAKARSEVLDVVAGAIRNHVHALRDGIGLGDGHETDEGLQPGGRQTMLMPVLCEAGNVKNIIDGNSDRVTTVVVSICVKTAGRGPKG